jgi:spore maturation protein CgeB
MNLSILYLGDNSVGSTARHRAAALQRLGHRVEHWGLESFCGLSSRVAGKLHYLTGHRFRQGAILRSFHKLANNRTWDVVWVDSGWWCGPEVSNCLLNFCEKLALLCCDDPFGGRDSSHWNSLREAIPDFDLCVGFREQTVADFRAAGAQQALRLYFGYDELAHAPESSTVGREDFRSEVAFIGTRMEDRHKFMIRLIERGVPLSIWGNGWRNGPGRKHLQRAWRGSGIEGPQYVAAIQQSKVCLGMLSRLNRDQHTTRSAEVPYAGGLLCAQRTPEHLAMYEEDHEAVFWADADECAEKCLELLADDSRRAAIRTAGAAKVRRLNIGNESMVAAVLAALEQSPADRPPTALVAGSK